MREFRKKIAMIATFALVATLAAPFPGTDAIGRLTEFQDILSRIKRSGAGAATSGYTESLFAVRSNFIFANASNEEICIDAENDGLDDVTVPIECATDDDTLVNIITQSDAEADTVYSGAEVAGFVGTAIETALRANANLAAAVDDDSYTVTYKDTATNTFVFAPGVNEDIYVSYDGIGPGDATLDIIADSATNTSQIITAHIAYTGAQVATALAEILNDDDASTGDDTYTVTYSTVTEKFTITETGGGTNGIFLDWDHANTTADLYLGYVTEDDLAPSGTAVSDVEAGYINRFQIRGDGGNDLNPDILWTTATTTADGVLGYTADDADIRDTVAVSDTRVQFNVIASLNDSFSLDLNGESTNGTETIDISAGVYTGTTMATELQAEINADWDVLWSGTVTVDYGSLVAEKFRITSVATGTESLVHIEPSASDFLRTVDMVNDVPKDGQATTSVIVSADHDISFVTENAIPSSGQVIVTFPSEFVIPSALNYLDVDFGSGSTLALAQTTGQKTLAAASGAGTTGLTVSAGNGTFTFELATDETIAADQYVSIRIGRNTITAGTGIEQIVNPTIPGQYQVQAETTEATALTFTTGVNHEFVWDPDGDNRFVFAAATNEDMYWDPDGVGGANTTADLITNGGLLAATSYTGAQVAAAIKAALEATNGSADTYTVTYNTSSKHFIIEPLSGTTEVDIEWTHANSTSARLLGYKTNDTNLYTVGIWESDIAAGTYVSNIVGGVIGSGTPETVADVAARLEAIFNDETTYPSTQTPVFDVTQDSPAAGYFTIAETGNSITNGQEPIFYWTWGNSQEAGVFEAGYTLGFTADDYTTNNVSANNLSVASDITSVRKQLDISYTSVYMVDNDQITLSAGVDPNLELEINGGLAFSSVEGDRDTLGVDFGSLEPNAYYKLGGAKTEYVKISVDMNCGSGTNEACIPASNETITIRGVVYTFKRIAADAATNDAYVYASITGSTQLERAAKLLTNLYRAINSSDENVRSNPDRSADNVLWVLSTSEGTDATLSGSTSDGTGGDLTVTTYGAATGSGVNSYYYKDIETTFDTDPTTYLTSLEGTSDFRGHNFTVNTNAADGYTLQLRDEGPDTTNPFRSWSDSADLGFGIYAYSQSTRWGAAGNTADSDDLIQEDFQGGETNNADPQGLTTSYQTVARNDVATARDNIMLEYNLRIDADQPAGNYQDTIDILVTAQY